MKLRPFIAAFLAFCMGSMSQPVPQGDCCGDTMDAATCLSACLATAPVAATPEQRMQRLQLTESRIPSLSLRYATVLAPPDVAPPKTFVS
jgi:hypothetical protein